MGVLTFEQKLTIALEDFRYRTEDGDGSGASRDKAFGEIMSAVDTKTNQLLDRLESKAELLQYLNSEPRTGQVEAVPLEAIKAERQRKNR